MLAYSNLKFEKIYQAYKLFPDTVAYSLIFFEDFLDLTKILSRIVEKLHLTI